MRAAISVLALLSTLAYAEGFSAFRYDDDFRSMRGDSDIYAQLKHIEFDSPSRYISVGGDMRERFEYYSRTNVGASARADDSFLLHRLLVHVDSHFDNTRLFVQFGNHEAAGREPKPKPTDVDHADMQQAFVDFRIALDNRGELILRGGRQEMAFGASRLIAVREGPNIRVAFDGARLRFKTPAWDVSAVAVRPVEIETGQFDDKTSQDQALWGIYATSRLSSNSTWRRDFYYFGSTNDTMQYDSVSGDERRNTFGLRVYGGDGAFDSDTEVILQNGRVAGDEVSAFAIATDLGWTWSAVPLKPRLGLRTDIISGDRDAHDGALQTFNALYPNGSYFSEASIIAQANLIDFAASVSFKPIANVTFTWSMNPLWRYSTRDALYTLPLAPLIAGDTSSARYIGLQNQLVGVWQYNALLTFKAALVKFEPGGFVKKGGGDNLNYAQFATIIRF